MNKLTKISTTALVALFLAACDKPAQKSPVSETQSPITTETKPEIEAVSSEAITDFQKLVTWNAEQEQALSSSQAELQQTLASQDPKQIQEGLSKFNKKVNEVIKSLESINVSDEQVKIFKEKTISVLVLSNEVIAEQIKVISTPNDSSLQHSLQQKTQNLIQSSTELQELQTVLQQRFTDK